ncbi:MAG: DMT family transporter [Nitrospiraceae bacterium]|nr:DMT family transporter [Nitrospiraceae bacterium]MDA8261420.1 DMT family transporter [Actinomycetota bacterium]
MGELLAVLSAVVWGSADFGGGMLAKRYVPYLTVLFSQTAALIAVAIAGLATFSLHFQGRLIWAVMAGVVGPLALSLYYRALSIGPMGIVGPVSATGGVVPVVVGVAMGERPTPLQLIGLLGCIIGVAVVSSGHHERFSRANLKVIGLSTLAALGFGAAYVALAQSAPAGVLSTLFVQRLTSFALMGGVALLRRDRMAPGVKDGARLAAVGIMDVSANGLFALSSRLGNLAIVGALGSTYPLTTAILAAVINKERLNRVQLLGAALTLASVVVVSAV